MKVYGTYSVLARLAFTILFILLLSFSQSARAFEVPADQYPFPTKDPYLATILSTFSSSAIDYDKWEMAYHPERLKLGYPLQKPIVNLQVYKQKKAAPLVLIIAGLGGNSYSTNSMALGDIYAKAGYHVILLPSNLSWSYAQAVSETGVPGYMPRDTSEYYQFIKWILNHAQHKKDLNYTSITLVGFSNGGVLAGFLAPHDNKQTQKLFKKVLIINPGIDLTYGIQQLDGLNDTVGASISQDWKEHIIGSIYMNAMDVRAAKDPVKALFALLEKLKIKSHHVQWLIGDQYRQSLRDIIVASHFVKPRVLKTPYSKFKLNTLEEEARTYNFSQYMEKFVIPTLTPEQQLGHIAYETSLYSQMEALKTDSRVYMFTNADDFLLKPTDIPLLREIFNERLFLFPLGGHMGNIMVPFNVQMYLKVSQ